jgi:hypothetical protein
MPLRRIRGAPLSSTSNSDEDTPAVSLSRRDKLEALIAKRQQAAQRKRQCLRLEDTKQEPYHRPLRRTHSIIISDDDEEEEEEEEAKESGRAADTGAGPAADGSGPVADGSGPADEEHKRAFPDFHLFSASEMLGYPIVLNCCNDENQHRRVALM